MIELIYESMLIGLIGGLMGVMYNYSLSNGAIFGEIGRLLLKWSEQEGFKGWIANPLGACIYCSTTWITIFIMALYWESWDEPPKWEDIIICTLAAIGMQHAFLRLWCYTKNHVEEK